MCHCGLPEAFEECCGKYVLGNQLATTPEHLMRSRYSAYVTKNVDYIFNTYACEKQATNSKADIAAFANEACFVRLEVVTSNDSQVEFKAFYIINDTLYELHELSNFLLEAGEWRYLDGNLFETVSKKLGRNDTCPCNSGKKYKKCHALI